VEALRLVELGADPLGAAVEGAQDHALGGLPERHHQDDEGDEKD
jgi:hypothetical protein